MAEGPTEFLLYLAEDGQTRIDVRVQNETVWLNQAQLIDLFQTTKQNISLHVRNILAEGELSQEATVKDYLTVRTEGNRTVSRAVTHYNLDMIIAIGFRVRSTRGTQFRQWAISRLQEYIVKGFAMDDERLWVFRVTELTNAWALVCRASNSAIRSVSEVSAATGETATIVIAATTASFMDSSLRSLADVLTSHDLSLKPESHCDCC